MNEARLMRRAVARARGERPHPNPRVGALVLSAGGRRVAEAAHAGSGHPHAEVAALEEAAGAALGGTLVVTLEPCVHRGRTGPCTEAILRAGIRKVVVGAVDPDRRVSGRGIERLRRAGLEVVVGVEEAAVEALDPGYFLHRRLGRPLVTWKAALTLDGQVAAGDGSSRWITSEEARRDTHRLRAASDAVMVGAGTVLADDPRLTVRLASYGGPDPLPVVVVGRRALPPDAAVFRRKALVLAARPCEVPAEVVVVGDGDQVDLDEGLRELGRRGVLDLLVEGGPRLAGSLWERGLVDRAVLYYGARLAGGLGHPVLPGEFSRLEEAREVEVLEARCVGPDLRVEVRCSPAS